MSISKHSYPALALNANHQVLGVWPWQDAVRASFRDSVYVVAEYEKTISSPTTTIALPSVVALRRYTHPRQEAAFTRRNVYIAYALFDNGRRFWKCAFCAEEMQEDELTFDHLTPRAQSGLSVWSNITVACGPCNQRKGNRSLEQAGLQLKIPLLIPTESELVIAKIKHDFDGLGTAVPDDWRGYVGSVFSGSERWDSSGYWDAPLDP